LTKEGRAPANPEDETSFDSDEFPKGPYSPDESDTPDHCAAGEDCLDAIELDDGRKVGAWLENALTEDGVNYTREAIGNGGAVAHLWAQWYPEARPTPPPTTFVLSIDTDNSAFENAGELPRLLRDIARRLQRGERSPIVQDLNGNTVGQVEWE
jgi:hypothetical protein